MTPYQTLIEKSWWVVLLVLFAAAFLLGRHVPDLRIHAGTSVLLNEEDPDLAYYELTRPMWGYDEYAIVCPTRERWIDTEGVKLLQALVTDLEAIPHVESTTSILDVPLLRQEQGPGLNLTKVPDLTSEGVDFDRAREELLEHTQAADNLISTDGRSLNVLVHLEMPPESKELDPLWSRLKGESLTDPGAKAELERLRPRIEENSKRLSVRRQAMIKGVREVARKYDKLLPEPVRLSGTAFLNVSILEHLRSDVRTFGIAAFLLFTLAFLVVYRRTRFVGIPILTCLLPVALILGAMSLLDMSLTVVTANLPVLLFTLMLPYTVYFVERYRERRAMHPDAPEGTATIQAAGDIWVPCFFSCATTMAGFAALMTSTTKPVHDFGLMTAIGMGVGLCIVFLAMPSMSRPLRPLDVKRSGVESKPNALVSLFANLSLRNPGWVLTASAVVLGLAVLGASRLSAQSKFTEYFKEDSAVYQGLEYIDTRMGGTTPLEIIVTAKEDQKDFFLKADGLDALRSIQRYFEGVPETGNVRSMATLVDELMKKNPALLKLMPVFARHELVRGVTRELADENYTTARVLVRLRETAPSLDRNVILEGLRAHFRSQPELKELEVRETGVFLLYANMLNSLMDTQQQTFLYVVLAIYAMLIILFRSPILAFLVLITQVLPALVMLGVMGWLDIPLDLITVMIASIAMGVGIDAAIQYTFRYRTELAVDGDRRAAVRRAHATVGRAIWIATSVIIAGFCVLMLSEFRPSIYFGLFTAIAMLMSQLAALTVLPSIFLVTGQPKLPPAVGATDSPDA